MKISLSIIALLVLIINAVSGLAQKTEPKARKKSVVWKIDNLEKIGGHETEVLGDPQVIKTENGKAVLFDGVDDAIFIRHNPLEGVHEFTVEAVFRPDTGGAAEQRWLHIEDTANTESRALLETRLVEGVWFLDTFLKSGDNRSALFAENFKHALGRWFHVALVFDGSEMRHYVDGKLELSGKITRLPFGKGITSIGVRQNRIYWFKAAVQKARFTNPALSPGNFMK
jgi:hypothetical protein